MEPYSETPKSYRSNAENHQLDKKSKSNEESQVQSISSNFVGSIAIKRGCNCKKSRCIKLYCECYASGVYCNGCNCRNCLNNPENEKLRKSAINSTLEKNPTAFQPKISNSVVDTKFENVQGTPRHNKGCSCKKSGCLKKYCECYQAGIPCTDICKCINCRNRAIFVNTPSKAYGIANNTSNKINYPQGSLKSNRFLYTIFLPGEDFSTKLDEEFKKANLIKKDLVPNTLSNLIDLYTSDVSTLLKKRGLKEEIGEKFEPRAEKKLIIQNKGEKIIKKIEVEQQKKPTDRQIGDDDLACNDEDFIEEVRRVEIAKETPKEEQITEYKIKKYLILKEFVKILADIDGNLKFNRIADDSQSINIKKEEDG